jgi:pentatricopeptide repeat protein
MILLEPRPDASTFNPFLHYSFKLGKVEDALEMLMKMEEQGLSLNTLTNNIVISGLSRMRGSLML